jgi:hypothetical protein
VIFDRRFRSFDRVVMKMGRWVRSGTAVAVVMVFVAALLAIVMIQPSGLSRAQGGWNTNDPTDPTSQLPSATEGSIHWEVGYYDSDGLKIYGLICYPKGDPAFPPPYPVLIINHGLDPTPPHPAILDSALFGCITMARAGWLVATSTYRAETIENTPLPGWPQVFGAGFTRTSDFAPAWWWTGGVEMCGGEVDDVLNLLSAVKALPMANPNRVLMWGHSHGSCITERAIERGAAPQIAVSIDGPTDFWTWKDHPFNSVTDPSGQLRHDRSSAYPDNAPGALAKVRFLRIQGKGDAVVPAEQGCELAAVLPGSSDYFVNLGDSVLPVEIGPPGTHWGQGESPLVCVRLPWLTTGQHFPDPRIGGVLGRLPIFLMYSCPESACPQGTPTEFEHGEILVQSWPAFATFVNHFISGWNASIPAQYVQLE